MGTTITGDRRATVVPAGTADLVELPSGSAFELLADASAARGAVSVNRLILTSGADGAKPHYHERSDETFYVLGGAMEFMLEEELVTVGAGGLLVVPPMMPHAFGAARGARPISWSSSRPGWSASGTSGSFSASRRGWSRRTVCCRSRSAMTSTSPRTGSGAVPETALDACGNGFERNEMTTRESGSPAGAVGRRRRCRRDDRGWEACMRGLGRTSML